jgi:hypothetical protein
VLLANGGVRGYVVSPERRAELGYELIECRRSQPLAPP